ncbi:MAG: radical SAM protein [Candidatus Nanoarchaeia archaeon]|nr:radical SAM protein [Candidatus Nanoarchaeia archaeon]MDD5740476.1 radical SAM protein [Candidatus Nanoarchaeia archaeon]
MKIQTFSIVAGTTACNAHCPYCISKMTPKQGISLEEPRVNWRNFEKACRLAEIKGITTVLITGKGEPTLYPKQITKFLENLKRFNFPLIELQTNGILLTQESYNKHLKRWYTLGLTMIALSAVHYKQERNKEIFSEEYPELENLIKKLHIIGFSVRISCTMLKGFIDNPEEVKNLIEKAKEWKLEHLSIRKLAMPKHSEDNEIAAWTAENLIKESEMTKIRNFVIRNGNKLMTFHDGAKVYDVHGQNICITDALTIEPDSDNLRQIIFFPDGHLRYDWQYKGAILI